MLLRPSALDLRLILHDLGRVLSVVAVAGLLPLAWALARQEWRPAVHILLMMAICVLAGGGAQLLRVPLRRKADWSHGLVVVALTWLLVPAVSALPLMLSDHYGGWLDAYFEAMSGITTSGLSLVQDLDHLPDSINMWRHTTHFLGGQGIVLAALSLFASSGATSLYQAEGRDERIFPSVASTARFIWLVSVAHLIFGAVALTAHGAIVLGYTLDRSLFHALTIFMAAFDTGGFSPQSSSVVYYHSFGYEVIISVLMIAGAMSFGLHHAIWNKRPHLMRNIEIRTILVTVVGTIALTTAGLAATYANAGGVSRRAVFQVISAHSGSGFASVSVAELARWSGLAYVGMLIAMALGGMSSSTAGGIKSLRIGLTVRAIADTVRAALLPERAVVTNTYQQYGRQRLHPKLAQSVMAVSLLYVGLYLFGAAVGVAHGHGFQEALFESVSASANVGLSVGITSPDMPTAMKIVMTLQMWVGRLEFIAVFALLGIFVAAARGK
ncbi:MAG: TrkH family potassium uptake protein [Acidimicrobiia bacterium]